MTVSPRLIVERIREIGPHVSLEIFAEMEALYGPLQLPMAQGTYIHRDVGYGDDARHRMNIFVPPRTHGGVLLFVHGGGFTAGDKDSAPGIFYDNVGIWAARQGMIGVTMNYRLAPDHGWPAGRDDVGAALAWLTANIGRFGGEAGRIFLMGQSAGAMHVAAVAADPRHAARLAGCICLSGLYDLMIPPINPAYFGADTALYPVRSPLNALAAETTPLLLISAEYDPLFIQQHMMSLLNTVLAAQKRPALFSQLFGHNHFSEIFHLNTADESLASIMTPFFARYDP